MNVSEKAKEKLDEAGKEIKEAVDKLREEVAELTNKVMEKLRGAGRETRESTSELTKEVKKLSERVKDLIPKRRKKYQLPVRRSSYSGYQPDAWEQPFLELRKATDHLFDDFSRSFRWPRPSVQNSLELTADFLGTNWPIVDIYEMDEEIKIIAELPGVAKDNIDISITDERVTISGQKKEQEEINEGGYYRLERSYGSFQRSFQLPCEVESDKAEAIFKDGILTVNLPKSAAASRRIRKIIVHNRSNN